jgi:hypothetical protein
MIASLSTDIALAGIDLELRDILPELPWIESQHFDSALAGSPRKSDAMKRGAPFVKRAPRRVELGPGV